MNEALQRRLLGAAVLFLLAFSLASLLPEPTDPSLRLKPGDIQEPGTAERQVVTYDLLTGAPVDLTLETQLDPERESTLSKAAAKPPVAVPSPSQPTSTETRRDTAVEESSRPAGSWTIQAGSFGDPDNAKSARQRLSQLGLQATVQEVRVGRALWYRVRVGPFSDETRAKTALEKVSREGFQGAKLIRD